MKFNRIILITVIVILSSCKTYVYESLPNFSLSVVSPKSSKLTIEEVNVWQHKDILYDSIPGLSLDMSYKKLLNKKIGDTVIVAVIDTRLDINHEEIKKFIWVNKDEIPNNGIDDDNNGYIDDVNGWNFLASKDGVNIKRLNYSYIRLLRKYKTQFENKTVDQISEKDLKKYYQFKKAEKELEKQLTIVNDNISYLDSLDNNRVIVFNKLKKIFPDKTISNDFLNNLSVKDTILKQLIKDYNYNLSLKDFITNKTKEQHRSLEIFLNIEYDEDNLFKDDGNDINDINYGNNDVSGDIDFFSHSTQVTGVIIADRNNNKGIKGIINTAKIMPVCIAPSGDERDKDIALGIRYAVDNGASIINITFTKEYPLHNEWVVSALKHAAKNDVLVVSSSGNDYTDLDNESSYPNDAYDDHIEYVDNFIKVGASWFKLNETLVPSFSNYGAKEVDIFAPGKYIYTTLPNNKYKHTDGTSMSAPMVAGVAALIRSYYPNLTAAEVKQIIMESGVSYDIMVNKPSTSKEKELVPFSSLSKSGKIVNAYNALLVAEEVSKNKKIRK